MFELKSYFEMLQLLEAMITFDSTIQYSLDLATSNTAVALN